jgi:uncharacterized protein
MGPAPMRTCTGCRARRSQDALIRVVRAPGGVVTVGERRPAGRGAYVCKDAACVDAALGSGALQRALRIESGLPAGLRSELLEKVAEEGADGET